MTYYHITAIPRGEDPKTAEKTKLLVPLPAKPRPGAILRSRTGGPELRLLSAKRARLKPRKATQ